MQKINTGALKKFLKDLRPFLIFLLISTAVCASGLANASNQITHMWNGNIILEASDSHLNEIIKELYDKYSVEVSGLEDREGDRVTFKLEAKTLETLLRGLLRNLGIKNFAIEYLDATLKRIVVVPDQISATDVSESGTTNRSNHSDTLNVVQIRGIVEFSQAEFLDLAEGDFIVEYDGVPITRCLVSEIAPLPPRVVIIGILVSLINSSSSFSALLRITPLPAKIIGFWDAFIICNVFLTCGSVGRGRLGTGTIFFIGTV